MAKAFIGCDPGAKGATCLLVPDENIIEFIDHKTSILDTKDQIGKWITDYEVQMLMIEDVHSIFGASAKSNFGFGFNLGIMHGLFRATGLGLDLVQPKAWQKYIGVKKKGKEIKKEVAEIAQRLYPLADITGPKGGLLDGRSDALMIAYYNMQKHK